MKQNLDRDKSFLAITNVWQWPGLHGRALLSVEKDTAKVKYPALRIP